MGLITGRPLASRARMISISSSTARVFLSNFLAFVVIAAFAQTAGKPPFRWGGLEPRKKAPPGRGKRDIGTLVGLCATAVNYREAPKARRQPLADSGSCPELRFPPAIN